MIRIGEVCDFVGVCRTTIYRWVSEGTFPSPVRISERAVRWRVDEIEAWRDAL
ncbi:MAG: AlpA family phage regulatory protein [Gammaproteobacteria bacterium]|nr:AlpA family phage regulatory protein [Gammaproteobacteria bacterium]